MVLAASAVVATAFLIYAILICRRSNKQNAADSRDGEQSFTIKADVLRMPAAGVNAVRNDVNQPIAINGGDKSSLLTPPDWILVAPIPVDNGREAPWHAGMATDATATDARNHPNSAGAGPPDEAAESELASWARQFGEAVRPSSARGGRGRRGGSRGGGSSPGFRPGPSSPPLRL